MKTFRLLTTILLSSIVLFFSEVNAQSACTVTIDGPTPNPMCAKDSFVLAANVTMGVNPTYSWSPGNETTASIKDAISGFQTYTVTVTVDGPMSCTNCTCTAFKTVNVSNLPSPSVGGMVGSNQTICSGDPVAQLSLTGYDGSIQRWEFSINGGMSWTLITNTNDKYTPLNVTQTTQFRAVVQKNPCNEAFSSAATITVVPASVGGTVGSNQTICSNTSPNPLSLTGHTGSIMRWELSTNGGVNWTPISNMTANYTPLNVTQTTQYRAVVKNGACPEKPSLAATITVDPPTIGGIVASSQEVCKGLSASTLSLGGQTGGVLRWQSSTNGGTSWMDIVNPSLNYAPGIMSVTTQFRAVVQSGSCPAMFSMPAIVTVNQHPIVNAGANDTICGGTSYKLDATAMGGSTLGYSYEWSDSLGNPHFVFPTTATTYTVTVTDSKGCTDTGEITISITAPTGPTVNPVDPSICKGESVALTASAGGALSYAWTPTTGLSDPSSSNPNASPTSTTTYTVTFSDHVGNTGCKSSAQVTVTVNNLPTASASTFPPNGFYCNGATIQLSSGGGVKYAWSGPNSFTSNTQNPTLTGAASNMEGTYTVTVTSPQNQGSCTASATVQVDVNPPLSVSISKVPSTSICPGAQVELTANPTGGTMPYSYQWAPNNSTTEKVMVITNLATPTYSVTITDDKDCTATANTTIAFNSAVTFSTNGPTQDGPYCEGATIKLHANANGSNLSYSWSGPSATGPIPNNSDPVIPISATTAMSGTYTVTASSSNLCPATATVTVNVYPEPVINVNAVGDYCAGSTLTLTANYSPTGVTNPTFVWRKKLTNGNYTPVGGNSPSYQVVNIQETTTYQVVISFPTNTNCNTDTAEVVVTVISDPIVTIDGPKTVCTNQQAIYYIAGNPGDEYFNLSDFIWMVGGGGAVVEYFQDSTAVVVKWGSSNGTISVKQTITSPGGKTCDFFGQYAVAVTASNARPADSIGYYEPNNIFICKDIGATCYQWGYYDRLKNEMVTLTNETFQAFGAGLDYNPDFDYWVKTWTSSDPNCNDDSSGCATVSFFRTEIYDSPTDLPKILLYPNPNNGSFKLEVNLLPAAEYELHIIDVLGRIVKTIPIAVGPDGILAENIQLSALANGLYFATLRRDSAVFLTRAFSIQH